MMAFTPLQLAALRVIFAETPDLAAGLRRQLAAAVTQRTDTGSGLFTATAVPPAVAPLARLAIPEIMRVLGRRRAAPVRRMTSAADHRQSLPARRRRSTPRGHWNGGSMPRKRKTLPRDFEASLKAGDPIALRAVFDACDVDARGRSTKRTALAFDYCPDELARWLVAQGADLTAEDQYGETPLHARAGSPRGRIAVLLALGADVRHGEGRARGTPLHRAASACLPENARLLIAAGAPVNARDRDGLTPLELALRRCTNPMLVRMVDLAEVLLAAGAQPTPGMRDAVARIGENFEFHRAGYNPDTVEATSAALGRLYTLFDVPPVPRRAMHDGTSPIVATADRWQDQFRQLWDQLVPSQGAAATVQGEVVRLAGRIARELDGNGGVNWDAAYRRMADAWLAHVGSGRPLPAEALAEAARLVAEAKRRGGDMERLYALAVAWVGLNPEPVALPTPDYER